MKVTGARPLLVLAAKAVSIASRVEAAADLATPGPGGGAGQTGPGAGAGGTHGGSCDPGAGGGGGGSGGLIFLEAPSIEIGGALAANGGGGGEGGYYDWFNGRDGEPGTNALVDVLSAPGGGLSNDRPGGSGGALLVPAGQMPSKGNVDNTGGGGGAAGRIWLRTRAVPASTPSGKLSPAPTLDTTL